MSDREERFLPYGRQVVDDDDLRAVAEVLGSDWLTTGPKVDAFEAALAEATGAKYAVAVSNGTAALHAAMAALAIGPGDEVVVPALTFAASANCVVYQGGTPVFADIDSDTLLIDPQDVERKITERTKAIVAVDYAGQPCDYDALQALAQRHDLALVCDACHALGGSYHGRKIGSIGDLSTFSFHPVKPVTTAEGGAITTDDERLAHRMRVFRNHGITTDHRQRAEQGSWFYEMVELGYNYRLSDLHCALGISQLRKLESFTTRRQQLAKLYDAAFAERELIRPLKVADSVEHAYHLYVVRLGRSVTVGGASNDELLVAQALAKHRSEIFASLREAGIGVNVHYIPVHLHPYYQERFGTRPGDLPATEAEYERILSLPLFPTMEDRDVDRVVEALDQAVESVLAARSEA